MLWRSSGSLYNVAYSGLSWSSASRGIDSIDGAYLGFDKTIVCSFSNGDCRTNAFPVRCVQELTTVFYIVVFKYHLIPEYQSVIELLVAWFCKFKQSAGWQFSPQSCTELHGVLLFRLYIEVTSFPSFERWGGWQLRLAKTIQ